jgi:hypothetical protein
VWNLFAGEAIPPRFYRFLFFIKYFSFDGDCASTVIYNIQLSRSVKIIFITAVLGSVPEYEQALKMLQSLKNKAGHHFLMIRFNSRPAFSAG